jgi:hypothetical protein
MKEGFDKEIDSLLRRRVGAGAAARAFGGGDMSLDEAHLDADELSAFAEGALPVSARVAAASHMADCDECRGLAVGLARASGAEAELERLAVAARVPASESVAARGRGWWLSLFAPRALRYAAPALALCLVAVVSFVALRSRWKDAGLSRQTAESRSPQLEVAKNQPTDSPLDSTATANANANASGIAQGTIGDESRNVSATNISTRPPAESAKDAAGAGSPVVAEDKKADEPSPPPPPAKAEGSVDSAPPMSKAGPPVEVGEAAKVESKEKSARQSQPEEDTAYNDSSIQQQRRANNQVRGIDNVQMPDGARNQKRGAVENAPSNSSGGGSLASAAPRSDRDRSATAPSAPASRRARPSEEQRERSEDDEANRAQDARSVAGHRFRRVGSAWVDLNYKSSMASTGVRRGTDTYRALVADIPEIGRVASQLGGEVIVVVKGRAYRIR